MIILSRYNQIIIAEDRGGKQKGKQLSKITVIRQLVLPIGNPKKQA